MLSVAPKDGPDGQMQLHASTVVIDGKGVALAGPSGVGKSATALALIARGATLLADDITWLKATSAAVLAHCPPALSGLIEARGVGILNAPPAAPAPLCLIVDLGQPEHHRVPPQRSIRLLGHDICVLHTPENAHFVDAIVHYVRYGRSE